MNKNILSRLITMIIVLMFIFVMTQISNNNPAPIEDGIVVTLDRCWDGDTCHFYINGKSEKVRFIGIDSPELEDYLGVEASIYVCNLLKNADEIILEKEPKSDDKDKFGRSLYWVFVDGQLLEEIIIRYGYGEVKYIYGDYKYVDILFEAQDYAKANNLGIWGNN